MSWGAYPSALLVAWIHGGVLRSYCNSHIESMCVSCFAHNNRFILLAWPRQYYGHHRHLYSGLLGPFIILFVLGWYFNFFVIWIFVIYLC
jgi:hypothetical protein